MIIIPDKLRRPAEVEREELRKQLSEARAEIERLKKALEKIIYHTSQQYYRESEKHVRITNEIAKTAMAAESKAAS